MKHTATALLVLAVVVGIGTPAALAANTEPVDLIQYLSSPFVQEGAPYVAPDAAPHVAPDIAPQLAGACDTCGGCNPCCDGGCGPRWTAEVGAVFLHRSNPPSRTMVEDFETGDELINATDLGLDWGAGAYASVIRHLPCGWAIQVRYFGVDSWAGHKSVYDPGALVIPFWNRWPGDAVYAFDDMRGWYGHDLYSLEFNMRQAICYKSVPVRTGCGCAMCQLRVGGGTIRTAKTRRDIIRGQDCDAACDADCCCPCPCEPWITLVGGFRWIDFREHSRFWSAFTVNQVDPFEWGEFDVDNVLHGFQVGAHAVVWDRGGPLRLTAEARLGLFGNRVFRTGYATGDLGDREIGDKEHHPAFLYEVILKATYRFSCCFSAFAGYELLWLDGVALAPQQKPDEVVFDDTLYHGVVVGLEANW